MPEIKIGSISNANLDAIKKLLMADINDVLSKEVFNAVKNVESDAIVNSVYKVYNPSVYKRRGDAGGLGDEDNIVMENPPKDGVLEVINITEANPFSSEENSNYSLSDMWDSGVKVSTDKNLPELIEYGHGNPHTYDFPRRGRAYMKPRKFTDLTISTLELFGDHIDAYKAGLVRIGYKVD